MLIFNGFYQAEVAKSPVIPSFLASKLIGLKDSIQQIILSISKALILSLPGQNLIAAAFSVD